MRGDVERSLPISSMFNGFCLAKLGGRNMRTFLLALLVLSCSWVSSRADEKAVEKFRNFTPEQIRDLPEAVRKSEVPIMYTWAARTGLGFGSELYFAGELNKLMYPGVSDYQDAVKSFQSDLGDKPTGVLTVWQIDNLEKRAALQKLGTVIFPHQFSSYLRTDFANVQGTTIIIDDRIAGVINQTKVECDRVKKTCVVEKIVLETPGKKDWGNMYMLTEYPSDTYRVTNWTKTNIEAVPFEGEGPACRTPTLSLNFDTKEFFEITRNGAGANTEQCKLLEPLKKPRISQIVDGTKIISEEFSRISKEAYNVLASDYRKKADDLTKKFDEMNVGTKK